MLPQFGHIAKRLAAHYNRLSCNDSAAPACLVRTGHFYRADMARKVKISSVVLNIRLHPHTPELYKSFLQDIFQLRKPVKVHGDRYAMISLINRSEIDKDVITGTITSFTKVELQGSWFDAENLAEATDEQVSEVTIPRHLHPNAATFFFHFDIKKHRIYVQQYSKGKVLTANQALTLFKALSEDLSITEKYKLASITLVQARTGLEELFSLTRLDKISITIMKPNSDILADDFEAQIEQHLLDAHARKFIVTYTAEPGSSLVRTPDIDTLAESALDHGNVEVVGRDEKGRVKLSTEQYPEVLHDKYDPETTTEAQAFRRLINVENAN